MTVSNHIYFMRIFYTEDESSDQASIVQGLSYMPKDAPDEMPEYACGYLSYFDKISAQMKTIAVTESPEISEDKKIISAKTLLEGPRTTEKSLKGRKSVEITYKFEYLTKDLYENVIRLRWPVYKEPHDSDEAVQKHFTALNPYK